MGHGLLLAVIARSDIHESGPGVNLEIVGYGIKHLADRQRDGVTLTSQLLLPVDVGLERRTAALVVPAFW